MSSDAKSPPSRLLSLDVLRAVAILLVLGRHMPDAVLEGLRRIPGIEAWHRGGWVGVDLFFVLSGFLVSGLLFREYGRHGRLNCKRFYVRRGLKIYPAFYVFIAISAVVFVVRADPDMLSRFRGDFATWIVCELLFVQNYGPGLWWHTWSLAVEEHFYIATPLLLLLLLRTRAPGREPFAAIPLLYVTLAAGLLLLRIVNASSRDFTLRTHVFATHLRIDSLLLGVLLAWVFHERRAMFERLVLPRRRLLAALGVAMLMPAFAYTLEDTPFIHTAGFTLFAVGSGLILCAAVVRPVRSGIATRLAAGVGAHSYSIYLWHVPVQEWAAPCWRALPPALALPTYVAASIVVGVIMARLVEFPVLKLRDRLFPSLAPASSPASAPGRVTAPGSHPGVRTPVPRTRPR